MWDFTAPTDREIEIEDAKVADAAKALVAATGRWSKADIERARAMRDGGNPYADRIQAWTFDQGTEWVNLMGERIAISSMDESYLLNVIAFLNRNATAFARVWFHYHMDSIDFDSDYWTASAVDYGRVQLAMKEPHRFMTQTKLMCALWYEIFKKRGRMNGFEDSGEDE